MKFNINQRVKVKLTEAGKLELERRHAELAAKVRGVDIGAPYKVDAEGYSSFQLWALMRDLGHLCNLAAEPPFETEIILMTEQ